MRPCKRGFVTGLCIEAVLRELLLTGSGGTSIGARPSGR